MQSRRSVLTYFAAFALGSAAPQAALAEEKMPVVASFSILADIVERVGGEHVSVSTLVPRNGNAHVFQPTPADARAVSEAQLMFVNGLQFEGWIDRLVEASDFTGKQIIVSEGVEVMPAGQGRLPGLHGEDHDDEHHDGEYHDEERHQDARHDDHDDHGDDAHDKDEHAEAKHDDDDHADGRHHDHHDHGAFDPHCWHSLASAIVYVNNVALALAEADPANAATYLRNRADYIAEIKALDTELREIVEAIPADRRIVVTSHNAFQYLGRAYGLTFLAPQGLSTESEAAAKDIAHLIELIRERGIKALFLESITDPRLLETIASETGAVIGGTLYPGALSEIEGSAPTYLDLMRHNIRTIAAALSS